MIVPYNNNKNSSALVWRSTVSMLGTIVRQYSAMQLQSLKQHKKIAQPFSRAIYNKV